VRGVWVAIVGLVSGAALALAAGSTAAVAVGWSDPFAISEAGSASSPHIVAAPGGRTTVLWADFGTNAVWMRVIRPDGTRGPERQVTPSADDVYEWQAAGSGTGGTVVLWSRNDQALVGRRIGPRGKLGPIREIAPRSSEASIAVDARGNATIAWAEVVTESLEPKGWRTLSASVALRRWNADGRLDPPAGIPAPAGDLSRVPRVSAAASGRRMALSWWQGREGPEGFALKAAAVGTDGAIRNVREIAAPERRWFAPYWEEEGQRLAVAPDGDVTLAWTRHLGGSPTTLHVRHMTSDGRLAPVHQLDSGVGSFATPVIDRSGVTTVVWTGGPESTTSAGPSAVRARRLDASGLPGRAWRLSTSERPISAAAAAVDGAGRVTAVWSERLGPYSMTGGIHGRQIGASGRLGRLRTVAVPAPGVGYDRLALAVDGRGTATAAWPRSYRVGSRRYTRILASRLVAACAPVRLHGGRPMTSRRHYRGHVRGVGVRVRSKLAAQFAVRGAWLSYRRPGVARTRTVRLPRVAVAAHGRHVRIVVPKRLRPALPAGKRVSVRLRLRARPVASGCRYGKPRTFKVAARVRWVKP
jgi:hypothetical protein